MPPLSNSDSDKSPRASSRILPRGIFTLKARSRRKTMSRKSIDSAPRSSMREASSFTRSFSQARASATVSATLGKTAIISSLVMLVLLINKWSFHLEAAVHVQNLAGDVVGIPRTEKPNGISDFLRTPNAAQEDAGLHGVAGALAHFPGHFGLDDARRHGVDGDSAWGQFDGERAGEGVDRAFAGCVIGLAAAAFFARNRTDIDDLATAFGDHEGDDGPAHVESADDVGFEHNAHVFDLEGGQRIVPDDTGIVDEQIDAAGAIEDLFGESGASCSIPDIHGLGSNPRPLARR